MKDYSAAENVLKTMLDQLGFEIATQVVEEEDGPCIQISSEHSKHIIGKAGDRLEDLQYLMNRIVSQKQPDLPRIKVDCDGFRKQLEKELVEQTISLASKVREDGRPAKTRPLNAYYRRLVHNAFQEVEDIKTSSPNGSARFKRITIAKVEA